MTEKECWVCGTTIGLECHHIFGGSNRKHSEKYGLKVWLCREHHTGDTGVHFNKALRDNLQGMARNMFIEQYGEDEFLRIFRGRFV